MSLPAVPTVPPVPPDVLRDLERRLSRVESFVGVPPEVAAQPPRRPAPQAPPGGGGPEPATGRDGAAGEGASRGGGGPTAARQAAAGRRGADEEGASRGRTEAQRAGSPVDARRTGESAGAPRVVAGPAPARVLIDEALVGGRLLAWAGGAALLFALGTLFWLGVRDGVITEAWRCVIGAVASVALLAAGLRNAGRGVAKEASWAMAGTGLAGLYATVAVATATYELLPGLVGLPALAALGVASALLALRWDAPPLAGVGLLGALGAPVIAPVDGLVLPVVIVAMAAVGLLLRHRPWTWLATAASVLALPQVVWHVGSLLDGLPADGGSFGTIAAPGLATVAVLAAGLAMVAGWEIRAPRDRDRWSMPLLLVLHAAVAAALGGAYALVDRPGAAVVVLAASAALLAGSAFVVRRRAGVASPVELVLLSVAVLIVDLGFAIAASGTLQLVGWAVTAVAFAVLARHAARHHLPVLIGGLGLHAGLALVETVGASGGSDGGFLVACAMLAAVCGVSARVVSPRSRDARVLLDVTALGVVLWWTAATLPADRLALVLAAEAAALLLLDRRHRDVVTRGAALAFLAIAAAVAIVHADGAALQATWGAVDGDEVWRLVLPLLAVAAAASVGVGTLRGAMTVAVWPLGEQATGGRAAGGASAAPVGGGANGRATETDVAAPAGGDADEAEQVAFDGGVRAALAAVAGGGVLLAASILAGHLAATLGGGADAVAVVRDVLWASTGLALLAAGLVRAEAPVRVVGLTLLAGIGAKIALLDLADVDTAGRVVAWAVLGTLMLVGAGLYARVRPEGGRPDAAPGPEPGGSGDGEG